MTAFIKSVCVKRKKQQKKLENCQLLEFEPRSHHYQNDVLANYTTTSSFHSRKDQNMHI